MRGVTTPSSRPPWIVGRRSRQPRLHSRIRRARCIGTRRSDPPALEHRKVLVLLVLSIAHGDFIVPRDSPHRVPNVPHAQLRRCLRDDVALSVPKQNLDRDSRVVLLRVRHVHQSTSDSVGHLVGTVWVHLLNRYCSPSILSKLRISLRSILAASCNWHLPTPSFLPKS